MFVNREMKLSYVVSIIICLLYNNISMTYYPDLLTLYTLDTIMMLTGCPINSKAYVST